MNEEVNKGGRPTDYSQELGDFICNEITEGNSLRSICRRDDMPSGVTIYTWLRTYPEFLKQYELATSERTESQQEELLDMGDKAIVHSETADPKAANAVVSAYKLKADNLKWSMSKMKPKKFGEKLDVESGGKPLQGNTIIFKDFNDSTSQSSL